MGVLKGTNLSQVNLSNLDLCLLDAHTLSLFFSVSTRTLAQMYSHITKHFAAPALSAKIKLEKKYLWHTKRKRWYSQCKLHTRPHMEHPNAHTHKQSLAKWLHRWGRDPVLLSPSLLHLPAIRLGADRENGGRGWRGAEGQEEDWWLGTEGGMIIPLTLCPIPGSHPAAPGEKREKDPANICDRSTPTH